MRYLGLLSSALIAAALGAPASAGAQAPLLTVGVDVTEASLTHATYALFVANRGDATATGVVLTNDVPANTTFSASDRAPLPPGTGEACAADMPAGATARCRWAIGDLPPGSSATVGVTYALAQTDASYASNPPGTVANRASVQIGNAAPADADPADSDSSLRRMVHVLDQDAHVDDARPDINFGGCERLQVRRDNAQTAFVDNDNVGRGSTGVGDLESVWGAELRATVETLSAGATVPIAAHRVSSHDWAEGAGGCAGANGSGREARAPNPPGEPDTEPQSSASPTATAPVAGPGLVRWDVRGALDTRDERTNFQGFELRAGASAGSPTHLVSFHSSDAASNHPRLVTVGTAPENGRCVDSDPEQTTGPSDREQRIDAYVTEGGASIGDRTGVDACPGFPVAGVAVGWELDDDSPDAYISNLAGAVPPGETGNGGDAGPNDGSTATDAAGRTFAAIRLADPYEEGANAGESRIAAIVIKESRDDLANPAVPFTGRTSGACEPGQTEAGLAGVPTPCSGTGEATNEDDLLVSWDPVPEPPQTPAGGGGGGGSGGEGGPGSGSGPTFQPSATSRAITLTASKPRAPVGDPVSLTGRLSSSGACAGQREFVQILRRRAGTQELTDFASVSTADDGSFELPVLVDASGDYAAVTPARQGCSEASSGMAKVLATGRVRASVSATTLRAGQRTRIYGRVAPALKSSVVLERRTARGWQALARQRLSRKSTFSFPVRAGWSGGRAFRVRWRSPSAAYLNGVSRSLTLRVR